MAGLMSVGTREIHANTHCVNGDKHIVLALIKNEETYSSDGDICSRKPEIILPLLTPFHIS